MNTTIASDPGEKGLMEQPGYFTQVWSTFKGPSPWVAWYVCVWSLALTVMFVIAAVKFLTVESFESQMFWGVIGLVVSVFIAVVKVWFFVAMARNTVLRRIASLEERLTPGSGGRSMD